MITTNNLIRFAAFALTAAAAALTATQFMDDGNKADTPAPAPQPEPTPEPDNK